MKIALIEVTTMGELSLGGAKGVRDRSVEVAVSHFFSTYISGL